MPNSSKQFGLAYLEAGEVGTYLERNSSHVLSVIGFGREVVLPTTACAPLWVDIQVLGGKDSSFEVWTSNEPVAACEHRGMRGTSDGKVLFSSLTLEQHDGETLETLALQAYMRIFEFIDHFTQRNVIPGSVNKYRH